MKPSGLTCAISAAFVAFAGHASAEGDPVRGEKLFNGFLRCSGCHAVEPGVTKVGPSLAGLIGRRAGSLEGYDKYSEAMMNSGIVWSEQTLDEFLTNPKEYLPGNTMLAEGYFDAGKVPSATNRADVIAYLKEATAE